MARTLTLDADVEAKLDAKANETGTDPQQLANEMLRRELDGRTSPSERFEITGPFVRSRPGYSFDNIEKLLDEVESPMRK